MRTRILLYCLWDKDNIFFTLLFILFYFILIELLYSKLPEDNALNITLNYLMARFGKCGVPSHCHCFHCYILWDDWPIFMISGSNEQPQQELECTLRESDWHSWWISKMQSGREDTLEEWYAIKFCFKLEKNATETYGMLQTAFGASCMSFWVA